MLQQYKYLIIGLALTLGVSIVTAMVGLDTITRIAIVIGVAVALTVYFNRKIQRRQQPSAF